MVILKNRSLKIWLLSVFVLVVILGSVFSKNIVQFFQKAATAAGSNASLTLSVTGTPTQNQTFTVPITLNTDSAHISGADVMITFDRTYLTLTAISPDAASTTSLKSFLPVNAGNNFDSGKVITAANQTGTVEFAAITYDFASQLPIQGYNGTTVLATLTFQAIQAGQTAINVSFTPSQTTDSNIPSDTSTVSDLLTTVANQTITINPAPTATPTATPTLIPPTNTPTPFPPTNTPTPTITPTPADTIAPQVTITTPLNGATVIRNSTIPVSATATDNVAVTKVEMFINTSLLCTDTTAPYSCSWKVPTKRNTPYTIRATATDSSNNTRSHSITVTSNR